MKWITLLGGGLLVLVFLSMFFLRPLKMSIHDKEVRYQVADTKEKQVLGLSGRRSLGENEALLFVMDYSANHGIWMKDMNFSIDIIWLDENKKVVTIKQEVAPDTYPEVFTPSLSARYILEVNAGKSEEWGLKVGDVLEF